jgi:cell division protein FtsB
MIPDLLKYGAIGLAATLSILAFKLLLENKKTVENATGQDFDDKLNLIKYSNRGIYIFMGFAAFLVVSSLSTEIGQSMIAAAENQKKAIQLDGTIHQMERDITDLRQSYQTTREELTKYKTMVEMIKEQTEKRYNASLVAGGVYGGTKTKGPTPSPPTKKTPPKEKEESLGAPPPKSKDQMTIDNINRILKGQKPIETEKPF